MYVHSTDVEGKPLQEDLITREAAGKSVHVLGQGKYKLAADLAGQASAAQ